MSRGGDIDGDGSAALLDGDRGRDAGVFRTDPSVNADALLTAEQLALRWQVPTAHVYRLTRSGRLPAVRLGRYRRYRLAAVETFELDGGTDE